MEVKKAINFIVKKLRKELSDNLVYHSVNHTIGVIDAALTIGKAEGLDEKDLNLVTIAAAYHDCGFLVDYNNHEENGCQLLENSAPEFGIKKSDVEKIKGMIMSTKIPQTPQNKLDKVFCDADLYYLGGKRYDEISQNLFKEMKLFGVQIDHEQWIEMQINFLSSHQYWTDFAKVNRSAGKDKVLRDLKNLVSHGA